MDGPHAYTGEVVDRLSRIEGHVAGIRRMVLSGRPCPEILTQLAAVRAAVDAVTRLVLEDHMEHCLLQGDGESLRAAVRDLKEALASYLRQL